MKNGDKKLEGTWAIVTSGSREYIGKLPGTFTKGQIFDRFGWVELHPAYDLFTPLGQDANGNISRKAIILPWGLTLEPAPLTVRVDSIMLLEDLGETDRNGYEGLIRDAEETVMKSKAVRTGLHLPTGGAVGRR